MLTARKRSENGAYYITEECERLFCETLKSVFLVEGNTGFQNSLVMDMRKSTKANSNAVKIPTKQQPTVIKHNLPTPSPSPETIIYTSSDGMVKEYLEVWDYTGGARFRGFIAEKNDERSMFVFFDREAMESDLKPG